MQLYVLTHRVREKSHNHHDLWQRQTHVPDEVSELWPGGSHCQGLSTTFEKGEPREGEEGKGQRQVKVPAGKI